MSDHEAENFPPLPANPSNGDLARLMIWMHADNRGGLKKVQADVRDLKTWRDGSGDDPGARMEIDRLKGAQESQKWVGRASITAGLSGLVAAAVVVFKYVFTGKISP